MKLLLTGAFKYDDFQIEYLKSLGFEIVFWQDERIPVDFEVSDIEAVVCNALFLYTPIENFVSLRVIQLTSAGLDRVPLDYIKKHNIILFNAKGVYSVPMAEFALCGILQLVKQSRFFYNNQKQHIWEKHRGIIELAGKNVCIIGAGSIGCEAAKRFKAFDMNVIGIDPHSNDCNAFDKICLPESMDKVLPHCDAVVLTLPLTEDNEGFFNKQKFELMKSDSIFVNIARGKLVNQQDLTEALINKKIGGCVLDVFEDEPLDDKDALWDFENVILTPHNSFVSDNNNKRMYNVIVNNLKGYLNEK